MLNPTTFVPLKIIASGIALPAHKVLSVDLDKQLNKPSGYVEKRSGIRYAIMHRIVIAKRSSPPKPFMMH